MLVVLKALLKYRYMNLAYSTRRSTEAYGIDTPNSTEVGCVVVGLEYLLEYTGIWYLKAHWIIAYGSWYSRGWASIVL